MGGKEYHERMKSEEFVKKSVSKQDLGVRIGEVGSSKPPTHGITVEQQHPVSLAIILHTLVEGM